MRTCRGTSFLYFRSPPAFLVEEAFVNLLPLCSTDLENSSDF